MLRIMVFNEFLVISNKISQSLHFSLSKLSCKTSIYGTHFESLKSVDTYINSKFKFKRFSFKYPVVSNYIVVTLTLFYAVKNGELKEEEIIAF